MANTNELGYKIEIIKLSEEDGGGYLALVPSLQGCMSDGETPQEALKNIEDAIKCWIETAKELGREVPAPNDYKLDSEYSGKLTLRIPKYLHKQLSNRADTENCSINQLIQSYISMGIGYDYGRSQISINVDYNRERIGQSLDNALNSVWKSAQTDSVINISDYTRANKVGI